MEAMNKEVVVEKQEKGATMVEYALMAALVAVVAIAGVTFLGQSVSAQFSRVASAITKT